VNVVNEGVCSLGEIRGGRPLRLRFNLFLDFLVVVHDISMGVFEV
jgi:hypothetical protein